MSMAARPTRPITRDEIKAFHRDGAVLLRGVLAPEWVTLVADGLEECFVERSNKSSEAVISGGTVRVDHMLSDRSVSISRFATESPVGGLVGAVLGGPVRFYMDQMFFRRPGPMAQTAFHQDASYHNVEPKDLVRAWVSPDVVPRSASLEVIRGSHRWNVTFRPSVGRDPDDEAHALKVAIARKRGMFENEGEEFSYSNILMDKSLPPTPDIYRHRDSFDIMGWDYNPGDLILFHGSLLHGTAKDVMLEQDRRAYAALYAGPRTTYLRQKGQKVPDPPALAAYEPRTGQKLDDFGEVFPLVWSPGDWD
ncbi:MAG: hypothetical protein F4Y27_01120 [Acidimicrobiaceae bacterium]|nr:hypothetical protein [Acidimicrobiaceae bacterium]MYG56849.1 hypothetical protein [Acidimicrobiaceae bacterium]MYJ97437.1 hypothetical protein [Acidimicrobiaceae bacterium]